MKELTSSQLKEALATTEGMLKGISVAQKQELKHLEESIASTEAVLESLKTRKAELQKHVKNLTARGY